MQNKPLILALLAGIALSGAAQATLMGRDLDGDLSTSEAWYDTTRNITWLGNANVNGAMNWAAANTWAAGLSFSDGVNTYANWRLPTAIDIGRPGCPTLGVSEADCGFNVDTANGELAYLFHDVLGNLSYYDPVGDVRPVSGLQNTGPFVNLQPGDYWYAQGAVPGSDAWYFSFDAGGQGTRNKNNTLFALAVRDGDIGAANVSPVPEPQTLALLGLGLLGLAVARRRG